MRQPVGISLLAYSPWRIGGIGTFAIGVTRALLTKGTRKYVLFVPRAYETLWRDLLPSNADVLVCGPHPDNRALRVLFEQFRLPTLASRLRVETVFFPVAVAPRWRFPRAVVTVPDLLFLSRGSDFPLVRRSYLRWLHKRLPKRASHIVTISEFCRRQICDKLRVDPQQVTVASPGVDPEFVAALDQAPARNLMVPEPYLLSVASTYSHKRLSNVVEAFRLMAHERPDLHLVFAGTHVGPRGEVDTLRAKAKEGGLGPRTLFLPPLSRERLPELFARASALVSSSEFEGFGIPVLEAMAMSCPVAAAPAEAVVELLSGCGWVAADFASVSLAKVILEALEGRRTAPEKLIRGRHRALSTYTWEHAAEALERVFAYS